jgi:periplasmic protein CpxP/Spy
MQHRNRFLFALVFCLASCGLAAAQGPGAPDAPGGPGQNGWGRPPMEKTFHDGHFGRWWHNPQMAQALNLTDDQKQKMDDIFNLDRSGLHDLFGNLTKQEDLLKPMIEADQPNEDQVLAQIDRVAQARAELEKANARMLFDIRKTLTPDQWQKLKALHQQHEQRMEQGGQGGWRHHGQPGTDQPPPAPGAAPQPPQGATQDGPPPVPGDGAPGVPAAPQL